MLFHLGIERGTIHNWWVREIQCYTSVVSSFIFSASLVCLFTTVQVWFQSHQHWDRDYPWKGLFHLLLVCSCEQKKIKKGISVALLTRFLFRFSGLSKLNLTIRFSSATDLDFKSLHSLFLAYLCNLPQSYNPSELCYSGSGVLSIPKCNHSTTNSH